jgi:hypothetical protein
MATRLRRRESDTSKHDAESPRRIDIPRSSVVVTVLIVGLVVGLLVGRGTVEAPVADPPPGLAGDDVLAMLADRVETLNTGTEEELAAFYSRDSVLEEQDMGDPALVTRGGGSIAEHLMGYRSLGFRLDPETTAIRLGRYVAEGLRWGTGGGVVVYELDEEGRIAHTWVIGGTP